MEKIILDCDPGHDDAIAILLAAGNPAIDLLGITTVSGNHNVDNTTRNALFLMTSRIEKFVGKTAVDTVAVRVGAIMSAIVVYIGSRAGLSTSAFAAISVALSGAWLAFVVAIGREHRRRSEESEAALAAEPKRVSRDAGSAQ